MFNSLRQSFKYLRMLLFLLVSIIVLNLLFQNCSKVQYTDVEAAQRAVEAERLALGIGDEVVTVGLNQVPNLKLFFVVDNSGTMKQNQLNLSGSFGTMFDSTSESLNKFDSTTYLINTAQSVPSFTTEKSVLDRITNQQSSFSLSALIPLSTFDTAVRSSDLNFGYLPGDNIGYYVKKTSSPLSYQFSPAMVLGVKSNAGQISLSTSIHKPGLVDVTSTEQEFKDRLAIMNSERIPQVLVGGAYQPEHHIVVDRESGLCAVSRVLRNPESYVKAGDLLSFTIVSDENDNDPSGSKCIQSITQHDGTEDLVDGDCKFKETQISYQTQTITTKPRDCKINGKSGYNFKFTYDAPDTYTTSVTYKYIQTPAVYKAYYYNLQYTSLVNSYSYYNTDISYYIEVCNDVYTDGIKTGTKCVVDTAAKTGSGVGNHVEATKCYDLAKSLNAKAVNVDGYKPVCTGVYKSVTSCSATDPLCKITAAEKINTVNNILGENSPATCLAKARTYADYNKNPVCTDASKNVTTCSTAESAARCDLVSNTVYGFKSATPSGDKTANGCVTWAQTQTGHAVASASDITQCTKNTYTNTNKAFTGSLSFAEAKSLDGGTTMPVGASASCGVLSSLAYGKAPSAIQATKNNDCVLTSIVTAAEVTEVLTTSDCTVQANNKCTANSNRNCTGTLVTYAPVTTTNPTVNNDKKVKEPLSCNSLCSDSKLAVCGSNPPVGQTIDGYLKAKYGAALVCSVTNATLESGKESLVAKPLSQESTLCSPSLAGEPRYFFRTKGPYRTQSLVTDYVSGKDSQGQVVPLVEYIKAKAQQLSSSNPILFSALVRKPTDALGQGGTVGVDYISLVEQTQGQLDSVLSSDYSVALKELSKVIKNNLERSFILKTMRPEQIITKVSIIKKGTDIEIELQKSDWTQSGAILKISEGLEFIEGDKFKVDYRNYIANQ